MAGFGGMGRGYQIAGGDTGPAADSITVNGLSNISVLNILAALGQGNFIITQSPGSGIANVIIDLSQWNKILSPTATNGNFAQFNALGQVQDNGLSFSDDPTLGGANPSANILVPQSAIRAALNQAIQGLNVKDEVACATTDTTGNLSFTGLPIIDGYQTQEGDRVLDKNETNPALNGIYIAAATGTWQRSTDANTWDELIQAYVFVQKGTINNNTSWIAQTQSGGTLGTTAIPFAQISGAGTYTNGTGLGLNGVQFYILDTTVTPGSYGSVSSTTTFNVNQQGQLLSASTVPILISPSQAMLGNVPNVDATNLANDTIQGAFTPSNAAIVSGDSGLIIAQKAQGQINNLISQISTNATNIINLQTNSIQAIITPSGTLTNNNQLQFLNSSTITWTSADSGNTSQITGVAVTATNSVIGISRPNNTQILITAGVLSLGQSTETLAAGIAVATQAQTNAGIADNVAVTPLKLANSTLASQVATNTTNITNLQANAVQTLNGITGNNIASLRDAQGNIFTASDSGNTTILIMPNASPSISGLVRPGGAALRQTVNDPLVWDAPLSQATNFLMNAQFNIWQRGTSFSITTQTKTFVADRWWVDTQTGSFVGTMTVTRSAPATFQGGYTVNTQYRLAVAITGYTSGTAYLCQSVEGVATLSSNIVVTGGITNSAGATSLPVDIVQYYGTGGTPSANVITSAGAFAYTSGANAVQILSTTGTVPSNIGKTLGTNLNDCITLRITLSQANTTLTFSNMQLQRGIISTSFDITPRGIDLSNCQEYCAPFQILYSGDASNGATYFGQYKLPTTMRGTPTLIGTATSLTNLGFPAIVGTLTFNANFIQEVRTCNALLGQNGATFSSSGLVQSELTY